MGSTEPNLLFLKAAERLPAILKASLGQTKVSFLIAGAQKCGTSALVDYLRTHPQICFPEERKEIHFFDNENIFKLNVMKDSVYHSFFDPQSCHKIIGESTPEYMYWVDAPRRIWDYNPKMKIVIILRSPIARAFSHWNMMIARGLDDVSFWDAIQTEDARCRAALPEQHRCFSYLSRGLYVEQLRRIWRYFPREQTLILRNKDLRHFPLETLNRVTDFLGIDKINAFQEMEIRPKKNPPRMNSDEKQYLIDYFKYEIHTLEQLLDWDCSDWLQ